MRMRGIGLLHEHLHSTLCSMNRAQSIALSHVFLHIQDCCHCSPRSTKPLSLVIPLSSDSLGGSSSVTVEIQGMGTHTQVMYLLPSPICKQFFLSRKLLC